MLSIIKLLFIQRKIKVLTNRIEKLKEKREKASRRGNYQEVSLLDETIRNIQLDLEDVSKEARKCLKQ